MSKGSADGIIQLSIIIPSFNEATRIGATLDSIASYLSTLPLRSEVLVVDDGSSDQTASFVRARMNEMENLQLLELPQNCGKGAAVRQGMLLAKGRYRLFMDADNSTSIEQFDKLLGFLDAGIPVVVGSRTAHGASIQISQPLLRRLAGWFFRTTVRISFALPVTDTQNGFKAFSAKAADEIFSRVATERWAFDVETLVLAKHLNLVILEVPVEWRNDGESHMTVWQALVMGADLIKIACRIALLRTDAMTTSRLFGLKENRPPRA